MKKARNKIQVILLSVFLMMLFIPEIEAEGMSSSSDFSIVIYKEDAPVTPEIPPTVNPPVEKPNQPGGKRPLPATGLAADNTAYSLAMVFILIGLLFKISSKEGEEIHETL